jgi:hypothetical protein
MEKHIGRVLDDRFSGDFTWFQGFEEIYLNDVKVYECVFHGGLIR